MIDKDFCMSSYLAFRYIEKDDVDFADGLKHQNISVLSDDEKRPVHSYQDISEAIQGSFEELSGKRLGILLSGGMDSASLAAYMPGSDAYTFRFLGGSFQGEELARAEMFAEYYGLRLHYVDINWSSVEENLDPVLDAKCAPVHSIEPQLYKAARQAMADGVEHLIVGESADLVFGGMDQLLSKDWTVEEFSKRYTFTEPSEVLVHPVDVSYLYERYRIDGSDRIDFLSFMDDVFSVESSSSYLNAFTAAGIGYTDPYARLKMADPLDLDRVRNGEPKYLVRALFHSKYPDLAIPNKVPMPRPVDTYFSEWRGPVRNEFREDIDLRKYSGNQKWQMWCLEYFLNRIGK